MPHSARGPIVPRFPTIPRSAEIGTALKLSEGTIHQLSQIWEADLLRIRLELELIQQELKPWYVRLWEWWARG